MRCAWNESPADDLKIEKVLLGVCRDRGALFLGDAAEAGIAPSRCQEACADLVEQGRLARTGDGVWVDPDRAPSPIELVLLACVSRRGHVLGHLAGPSAAARLGLAGDDGGPLRVATVSPYVGSGRQWLFGADVDVSRPVATPTAANRRALELLSALPYADVPLGAVSDAATRRSLMALLPDLDSGTDGHLAALALLGAPAMAL